MASTVESLSRLRRWKRLEYERLVELGVFRPGERLELIDGLLVVREPHGSRHAAAIRRVLAARRHVLGEEWQIDSQLPIALDDTIEVNREPEASPTAPCGWRYRCVEPLRASASVAPLIAPRAAIPVADLPP